MNFGNFDLNTLMVWLVFGLVIGLVIHMFDSGNVRGGLFGSVLTGIVGAVVGGLIAQYVYGSTTGNFDFPTLVISMLGALSLVVLQRLLFRDNRHIKTTTLNGENHVD